MAGGIAIWAVLGFCGAYIGYKKGYSSQLMALLGVLGGPFLLLVVYFLFPRTAQAKERDIEDQRIIKEQKEFQKMQICPGCNQEITAKAWVCGLCGYQFVKINTD